MNAGDNPDLMDRSEFKQVTPWPSPETYNMILKAAHDGAQALVDSPEGHLLRTVRDVFVRVDVVLGAKWLSDGEVELMPLVNELDWLNSAGMLTHFWRDAKSQPETNAESAPETSESEVVSEAESAPETHEPKAGSEQDAEIDAASVPGGCLSADAGFAGSPIAAAAAFKNDSQAESSACSIADVDSSQQVADINGEDAYMEALQQSPGYKVARALYAEILKTGRGDHAV